MSELLEAVKNQVEVFLNKEGYVKRGKNDFVKKGKTHKREEVISFTSRKRNAPHTDQIYIGVTSGIYCKDLNILDKKIEDDFLNSYPIISGSIGHYNETKSNFVSIPINSLTQIDQVSNEIIDNIKKGAFNLFSKYSDLKSVLEGINRKDEWLNDYHKFIKTRRLIRVAAMYLLVEGKDIAIEWFKNNVPNNENKKLDIIKKIKQNW